MSRIDFWGWSIILFCSSIGVWWVSGREGWPISAPVIGVIWIIRGIYKWRKNG